MRNFSIIFPVLIALGTTSPGSVAQAALLFVSQTGNDGGATGSFFAPFRTLQGAINGANSGDTLQLEGGDYGGGVITNKTLTIQSADGGGIYVPGGPGLIINNGVNDTVTVREIIIDQGGSANNGIQFNSGHKLNVLDSLIENGSETSSGIFFQPNNATSELHIRNSVITGFGTTLPGSGVRISPRSGADVTGSIYGSTVQNANNCIRSVAGAGSLVDVFVVDSVLAGGCTATLFSSGTGSEIRVQDSVITNNTVGVQTAGGGKVISGGNNSLVGNGTDGTFTGFFTPK